MTPSRDRSPDPGLDAARLLARLAMATTKACEETGTTLPQYRLILRLVEQPLRVGELADLIGVSAPTVSVLVRNLERRRLVERSPVPGDGRGVMLTLTDAGRAAVHRGDERMRALLADLGADVGLARLIDLLEVLRDPVERVSTAWKARHRDDQFAGIDDSGAEADPGCMK